MRDLSCYVKINKETRYGVLSLLLSNKMSFSDSVRSRFSDNSPRRIPSRASLFSSQGGEDSSFSNSSVANSHLNKTLSKLIDRFDISPDNQNLQETQRKKERLLESYNNILTRYVSSNIFSCEKEKTQPYPVKGNHPL